MNALQFILGVLGLLSSGGVLLGALVIGSWLERRHFARLAVDEAALAGIMVSDLGRVPANWTVEDSFLVAGEVAIANDRFKSWVAGWLKLFGGSLLTYESLLERARREAFVRLKRAAAAGGAHAVWNVRLTTLTLQEGRNGGGVHVMVYGTALRLRP